MKCEECLPLIEEYVDGELDGRMIERLDAHLSTCAACGEELTALRREQEVYSNYRRDLEVTPAHWNIVRARIEQEKDAAPRAESRPRFGAWLGGLFGKRLRPAFVVAVVLVTVAITAAVIYLRSRENQGGLALKPSTHREEQKTAGQIKQVTPDKISDDAGNVAQDERTEKRDDDEERPQVTANNKGGGGSRRKAPALARVPRPDKQAVEPPTPDDAPRFEEVVAASSVTGMRANAPVASGEFDFEIARHAGRAELLLRSFRNVRPVTSAARRLDVSFEKGQSRKLLYKNIALRRAAGERN
ncbi:MAG TPA: zf-HC2 domain-containing protein, partial [Pyrinomonadaceae bacterium]|nr:zf-HC2 domain-containing protein [Pyrinomonadaceae bacterium]